MATVTDSREFRFDLLKEQAPICGSCEEEETIGGSATFAQYEINDIKSIWCRVMCRNPNPGKSFPKSLLGPEGHLERMNVWTHFIAAILYLLHVLIRPLVYGNDRMHLSNFLVSVGSSSLVVTFLISSAYHVYSANRFWSAVTRLGDYFGIYVSIATGMLVDVSVSTLNLNGVRWQATWDVYIAMAMMVAYFVLRRIMTPIDETRLAYLKDRCALGLARSTNTDLEHSSLRAGAGVVMAFCWILAMPGGYATLERDCADAFLLSHVIATLILVSGMVLDNVFLYPDTWFENKGTPPTRCVCYSSRPGCGGGWIMTSHALWHIISVFSTLSTTVGLEYIVANSDVLDSK